RDGSGNSRARGGGAVAGTRTSPFVVQIAAASAEGDRREPVMETQTPPSPPASAANPARDQAAAESPAAHRTPAPPAPQPTEPAADGKPTCRERLGDALRYLCTGRMPTVAIGGTLVFPLVLALGAMLTAISDVFVLRLIAVVPALFLLSMVGVACQHTVRCAL